MNKQLKEKNRFVEKWKGRPGQPVGDFKRTLAIAALALPALTFAASASAQQDADRHDHHSEWRQSTASPKDDAGNQLFDDNYDFYDNSYFAIASGDANSNIDNAFENARGLDYYDSDWANNVEGANIEDNGMFAIQPNLEYGWSFNPLTQRWSYGWHRPNPSSPSMGPVYGYYGNQPLLTPQFTNPQLTNPQLGNPQFNNPQFIRPQMNNSFGHDSRSEDGYSGNALYGAYDNGMYSNVGGDDFGYDYMTDDWQNSQTND